MTQADSKTAVDTAPGAAVHEPITAQLDRIQQLLGTRLLGKPREIRLALTCLLADGHLLIDDVPGIGKTTLGRTLADVLGLSFARIQFTSDLLPSDILGVSVFDRGAAAFNFRPGPIFAQLVLADEINRASPKTQSALLEAMAERQVTIEGDTHQLDQPFSVIATQNPGDHAGTFPLPESQLDRFFMRIGLGYPPTRAEKQLLATEGTHGHAPLSAAIDPATLTAWQRAVSAVATEDALLDYLLRLVHYTREQPVFVQGLSPRGGLALRHAAQAWAMLSGRDFVLPEDVQAVLAPVVDHRLSTGQPDTPVPSAILVEHVAVD